MENKDSILFYELDRVLEMVRKKATGKMTTRFIVENVMMDKISEHAISKKLGCRP